MKPSFSPFIPSFLTICWKDGSDSSQLASDFFLIYKIAIKGGGRGQGIHFNFPIATACIRKENLNFTA